MPIDPRIDPAKRDEAKKWRTEVADLNRQIERVVEIGDLELALYAAAAIGDCLIDFKRGTLHERDASRETPMSLTPYFSRVRADGAFLHNENMNLPPQEDEDLLEEEGC